MAAEDVTSIAEIREYLVRVARYFHAPEPEDAAQIILFRAWRMGELSETKSNRFWWRAAYNQALDQRRKVRFEATVVDRSGRPWDFEEPHGEPTRDDPIPDCPDKEWLLGYYGAGWWRKGSTPSKDRIRACRAVKRLRTLTPRAGGRG